MSCYLSGLTNGVPIDSDLIFESEDQPSFLNELEDNSNNRFNSVGSSDSSGNYNPGKSATFGKSDTSVRAGGRFDNGGNIQGKYSDSGLGKYRKLMQKYSSKILL